MSAPSGWQLEMAMSALQSCRARLAEADPDDTDLEAVTEAEATETNVRDLLRRAIIASMEAKAFSAACADRIDDLALRRDRYKARADMLRATAFAIMDALGETKIVEPEFTATVAKPRASLLITDEAAIPDEYMRVTRAPDKSAIQADIKQGVVIPGVEMANGMPTLMIRNK